MSKKKLARAIKIAFIIILGLALGETFLTEMISQQIISIP